MSSGRIPAYSNDVLDELNAEAERIHSELQSAGAPEYPSTSVDFMDVQDRRDIGEYLCKESGMDYCSSLRVINRLGMIYRNDEDRYLATDLLLDPEVSSDRKALLSHEAGHRFGRKVIQDQLVPIKGVEAVPDDGFDTLVDYLLSENFAERVKVATGETFGHDFVYDERFVGDVPAGYELRARIGPEELVDPGRDEDLNQLVRSIEEMVDDLSSGVENWN